MARRASDLAPRGHSTRGIGAPEGDASSGAGRSAAKSGAGMSLRGDLQRPRYFVSIAAELASVHPRTLRIYDEEGLLCPQRRNNLSLYSEADIRRERIIRFLTWRQGVNPAGVKVILQLEALGKIRVYDLFDGADVERYVDGDEPEPVSDLDRRDI